MNHRAFPDRPATADPSTAPAGPRPPVRAAKRPLALKIGAIGCGLLLLALSAIGLTLWQTWQLEGGAAAVNEAGRMRMQTWRLAQTLTAGDTDTLRRQITLMDESLVMLQRGDASRPLAVPADGASTRAFDAVRGHWTGLRTQWAAATAADAADAAVQAEQFVAAIDRLVDAIEHQLARWTAQLNAAQLLMLALAIAAAITLMTSAQLLVFNPLTRLQAGLAAIESGNLSTRIDAPPGDEFGEVEAGFNRMAGQLQALYENLESRVVQKTLHLEAERARLATLYDAAAFVTRTRSLDVLTQGFATRARRMVRADAVAVRWSDEQNRRYVLLASEGLPAEMIAAEHCVPTGDCFCGQPRDSAATQVIALHPAGVDHRERPQERIDPEQCRKAGFTRVISVPVRLQERLVGEIDLFFHQPGTLDDEDRTVLETLATHLAGAMEGLRADALQREAAVAEERGLLARELHDSIAQSLAFLKIQATLLRDDIQRRRETRVQQTLGELDEGIRESLSDVRELLLHFRTRTNAEDIAPALRTTLTKFEHQTGLPTRLTMSGEGMALPPDVQIQVLHVVQEALSNVRKHARARQVRIDVQQSPNWVVRVTDDGCGIADEARQADETHVGLRIMRERAGSIGASLAFESPEGGGTCVTLTLPAASMAVPSDVERPLS